eukprot:1153800-Pyramimonas_sp.AAC.1
MGGPPKVPVAPPACVRHHPAQSLFLAFHRPSTALRGPMGGSTEGPSGTARMRPPPPSTARAPCASPTQYNAPWPHREFHR